MELRLSPAMLSTLQNAVKAGAPATGGAVAPTSGPGSFSNALGDALKSVSQSQEQSGELQKKFQAGVEGVSLEETMVAMQKAQVGFQAALAVRSRLVSAYTDIMNMSV